MRYSKFLMRNRSFSAKELLFLAKEGGKEGGTLLASHLRLVVVALDIVVVVVVVP